MDTVDSMDPMDTRLPEYWRSGNSWSNIRFVKDCVNRLRNQRAENDRLHEIELAREGVEIEEPNPTPEISYEAPERWYWKNLVEYYTVLLFCSHHPLDGFILATHCGSWDKEHVTGGACVLLFYVLTKLLVDFPFRSVAIMMGIYHKQCTFLMSHMIPAAKFFPFLMFFQCVLQAGIRIYLLTPLVTFIFVCMLRGFQVDFYNARSFDKCLMSRQIISGVKCYNTSNVVSPITVNCWLTPDDVVECPDKTQWILPISTHISFMRYHQMAILWMQLIFMGFAIIVLYKACIKTIPKYLKWGRRIFFVHIAFLFLVYLSTIPLYGFTVFNETLALTDFWTFFGPRGRNALEGIVLAIPKLSPAMNNIYGLTSRVKTRNKPALDAFISIMFDLAMTLATGMVCLRLVCGAARRFTTIPQCVSQSNSIIPLSAFYLSIGKQQISGVSLLYFYTTSLLLYGLFVEIVWAESLFYNASFVPRYYSGVRRYGLMSSVLSVLGLLIIFLINRPGVYLVRSEMMLAFDICVFITYYVILNIYSSKRIQTDMGYMLHFSTRRIIKNSVPRIPIVLIFIAGRMTPSIYAVLIYFLYTLMCYGIICYELINYGNDLSARLTPIFTYGPPNYKLRRERKMYVLDKQKDYVFLTYFF